VAPLGDAAAEKQFAADCAKLRQARQQRGTPRRDEAATSGTHGLLLTALSRAGKQLADSTFSAAAKAESAFILEHLRTKDGSLRRLADQSFAAAPIDYGFVINGLLSFAAATGDKDAERAALALLDRLNATYRDPQTNRYLTVAADAGPAFWARLGAPSATSGEVMSTEAALLTALRTRESMKTAAELLTPIVAADLKNAVDAPVGELLLALSPAN
jgi:uncharacterized protein YyaL (SSP411 family)